LDFSVQRVEKEIKGGDTAFPGDDEISPGVSWRLATRPPLPTSSGSAIG
jgi:hypothetical protein